MSKPRLTLLAEALGALEVLCWRGGIRLDDSDRALLQRRIPNSISWSGGVRQSLTGELSLAEEISCAALTTTEASRASQLFASAYLGLYDAAADGIALSDVNEISRQYHASVSENYPEAGPAFLCFATTYWTFRTILGRLDLEHRDVLLTSLFERVDDLFAPLFFPQDGPLKIDASRRESDQRQFLSTFGPRVDREAFLQHNPILMRDRRDHRVQPSKPAKQKLNHTFLYLHGASLIQLILVVSIIANLAAAMHFFGTGATALGIWAVAATVLIPRTAFALFLIAERDGSLYSNLTGLLSSLYRRTIVRYQPINYETYLRGGGPAGAYVREALILCVWLVPIAVYASERR